MATAFLAPNAHYGALRALNYTPEVEALRSKLGASRPLGKLISSMGPAYGAVFTRIDCEPESGVELVSQSDMFAAEPQGRVIRMDSMARPERHRIQRWQVLIAGAGTLGENELYGRSIIADGRLENRYVGPHAMTLTFVDPGNNTNLFAYAFLCSKIGIRALRSVSYGTKILGIRKDLLAELPIPLVEKEVEARVASLIRRCVEQRETYLRELQTARRLIEELPAMRAAHAMCAERKARTAVWKDKLETLCAWNYASTGDALSFLLRTWSRRLGDVVAPDKVFRGGRYQRVDCQSPHGVELMSQRDVFCIRPTPRRIKLPKGPRDMFFVPEYSLLVGGQGTLGEGELFGQAVFVTPDMAQSAISEHLLRIQPAKREDAAILAALLGTVVGLRLVRSCAVGTKLLGIRSDLLLKLPLPELSPSSVAEILKATERASIARVAAAAAELKAIRIIEDEVLPSWLA